MCVLVYGVPSDGRLSGHPSRRTVPVFAAISAVATDDDGYGDRKRDQNGTYKENRADASSFRAGGRQMTDETVNAITFYLASICNSNAINDSTDVRRSAHSKRLSRKRSTI